MTETTQTQQTPIPWRQGELLNTYDTLKWDDVHRSHVRAEERTSVFASFHNEDQGRSRSLICRCFGPQAEGNAALIVTACNSHADLVTALGDLIDLVMAWQEGILKEAGITWTKQPPALTAAVTLLDRIRKEAQP